MTIKEIIAKYDPSDQFEVLTKSYEQIEFAWNNKIDLSRIKRKGINSIILSGLGGSAISGDFFSNFFNDEFDYPFFVNRNYTLPSFADKNTLVIISSYSGNTEETISVFNHALKKNCRILCITSGGKIEKIAEKDKIPVIKILPGFHPRYALGLSFFSLLKVMNKLKIVEVKNSLVNSIIKLYKEKAGEYSKEKNAALLYAEQILGSTPIIYSAEGYTSSVGYRFKCQFNENSKLNAYHNVLPEMNHNEIVGWESFNENQKLIVFNIVDKNYPAQIKKRFSVTNEILAKAGVEVVNLESNEKSFKVRLMDLIYLCDWITYYTGILRGFNPAEINNIDFLKNKLK